MVLVSAATVLPRAPGVYRFKAGGRVLYVGRATDLRSRVRSYAGDLRDRRHLSRMVPQITSVEALECASVHEAAWLERTLLEQSLPRWNRTRGGAEVPCWLVLDDGARTASLRLVTGQPEGRRYGPYLGTERAALVVSGLRRVAPLDLTRVGLGASEADLARTYGVGPDDRNRLADLVAAVLDRDPAAVTWAISTLTARRESAIEATAYEGAARITAELAAVQWAVAPQRVIGAFADVVVAGFVEGVLVQLAASNGRLGTWTVRTVSERTARPLVDETPPQWRDFATRAASLAAALRAVVPAVPSMGA